MLQLPEAFAPMAPYCQFLIYKVVPPKVPGEKPGKLPCDPRTGQPYALHSEWQKDPAACVDFITALLAAKQYGPAYGLGFLFKPEDPFFFLDIDHAYDAATGWNARAQDLCARFPDCAVEVSTSGTGLHIIGTGTPSAPEELRRKKSATGDLELYTQWRFVALTGTGVRGSAGATPAAGALDGLVSEYFSRAEPVAGPASWTEAPSPDYTPLTDPELLERACRVSGAAAVLGGRATFRDLFAAEPEPLARSYPTDPGSLDPFDRSGADAALAQMLAFWTGRDCARIERLMYQSALVREKWNSARTRGTYLQETILNAVARQETVYTGPPAAVETDETLPALQGSSRQIAWAEQVRAQKLTEISPDTPDGERLARERQAQWWIDNRDRAASELAAALKPVEHVEAPTAATGVVDGTVSSEPQLISGYQYLGATQQLELFQGCVYVQSEHRIFTPSGDLLKQDQFNATYGGYVYQLDDTGRKTTRKAWDAFTESQIIRFPKSHSTCYRPDRPAGELITKEGRVLVNSFVPASVESTPGDVSPLLEHMRRLLPSESDREILLSYMAACVQLKGRKFQWAPLIQGVEGNGKTLFTRCVQQAVGLRHTHLPRADNIGEKYNAWIFGKVFIGVEDIYVTDQKRELLETLKPMITGEDLERRAMHSDQDMRTVCANFIFNSNHKDAVRKGEGDRRFCVFYTRQQAKTDLQRDGLTADYFGDLYDWLKNASGYAIVSHYLQNYPISEEFKKQLFYRAPETSSTAEAIQASRGGVEQEVEEAIAESTPGFSGGWISSIALNQLLDRLPSGRRMSQRKRAEMLEDLGYIHHPGLRDGRTTTAVISEGGRRPRLYIKTGHLASNLTRGGDILNAYLKSQGYQMQSAPESANTC